MPGLSNPWPVGRRSASLSKHEHDPPGPVYLAGRLLMRRCSRRRFSGHVTRAMPAPEIRGSRARAPASRKQQQRLERLERPNARGLRPWRTASPSSSLQGRRPASHVMCHGVPASGRAERPRRRTVSCILLLQRRPRRILLDATPTPLLPGPLSSFFQSSPPLGTAGRARDFSAGVVTGLETDVPSGAEFAVRACRTRSSPPPLAGV